MHLLVANKVPPVREAFGALRTFVRLVSDVDSLVATELRDQGEGFPAVGAIVEFLPCVYSLVPEKV